MVRSRSVTRSRAPFVRISVGRRVNACVTAVSTTSCATDNNASASRSGIDFRGHKAETETLEQFRIPSMGASHSKGIANQGVIQHVEPALFPGILGKVVYDPGHRR